jgi:tight adherence protein C
MQILASLFDMQVIIMALVSLAAFATVVSVAMPYFEGDRLQARLKAVNSEREKLRSAQRAQLNTPDTPRLREKAKKSVFSQLVEVLNLRKVFSAETSREQLRQAGYRNENHLMTYLAMRAVTPLIVGVIAFIYFNAFFQDKPMSAKLLAAGAGMVVGYMLPATVIKNYINKRQLSIKRAWSDALDLLLICVESGMALEPSMQRVAKEIGTASIPLAEELALTVAELSYLQDRRKALDNLGKRTGLETVKSVVTSLIQAEKYGTPLGTALRALAQENREARMAEAERKAAALGPKLTVPMMLFFMPVIFIVLLTPSAIKVMDAMAK